MNPKQLRYLGIPLHKSDPKLFDAMVKSVEAQVDKTNLHNMEGMTQDMWSCFMAFGSLCWYMGYLTSANDELKKLVN